MGLLVAVFNQSSEWPGRTITYEDVPHQFILEGRGPISAQALLGHDAQGQLDWADEGLRDWTQRAAQAASQATQPDGEAPPPSGERYAAGPKGAGIRAPTATAGSSGPDRLPNVEPTRRVGHAVTDAPKSASVQPDATRAAEPDSAEPSTAHPALAEAGLVCSLFGLGVPLLGVLGLVLSIHARREAQRLGTASGLATAGIVVGIVGTVVGLLLALVALVG